MAALFRCSTPKCFASVSLKTDAITNEIKEPFVVSNNNSSHLESCLQKDNDYFEVRGFIKNVKDNIVKNNSKTTQQIYDEMRNTHHGTSETTLPDYNQIKFKSDLKLFCLALIPIPSVDAECISLQKLWFDVIAPNNPNIGIQKANKFWQYFIDTFFEGQFTVRMWNHFDNNYERTNNRVEGDNNKMKLYCGAANPNIDKAVRLLQQHESASSDKYKNAKKKTAKAPYKSPDQQKKDAYFKQQKKLLNDESDVTDDENDDSDESEDESNLTRYCDGF
ncbi:unnamed protein product [Brachionus calyciflorus]|uniref:Uncharacterized protein n=1 Tax=Brachionus calyciflorus TaxID=104777 RepID=A0A814NSG8_9BILA|nr:unnamed protein product [Brachionus calyciflorus]